MTARSRLAGVQLYLIASFADAERAAAGLDAVDAAVAGGVQAVQLRLKGASTSTRRTLLGRLRRRLGGRCLLLVNDDLEAVFEPHGAPLCDGVHLGRDDAAACSALSSSDPDRRGDGLRIARERLGPELCLGTSTREAWELELALRAGADHVGFGAMAHSSTKSDTQPATLDELVCVTRTFARLAVFPIGGLDAPRLEEFARLGIRRAAVGSAILAASDPEQAARACRAALGPLQT